MGRVDRFDPGLQPERTLLAWRRTCLAFALGSLVLLRFTLELLGAWAIVFGAAGVMLAAIAYGGASIGFRRVDGGLRERGALRRDGLPMAAAAVAGALVGVSCAGYLVARAQLGLLG